MVNGRKTERHILKALIKELQDNLPTEEKWKDQMKSTG
jgi:hypothetical protein